MITTKLRAARDAFIHMIEDAVSPLYGGMVIGTADIPSGVSLTLFFEEKGWTHLPLEEGEFGWTEGFLVRWGEGKINPTPLVFA